MTRHVLALLLSASAACHSADLPAHDLPASASASAPPVAGSLLPPPPATKLVWRVMQHTFVEDDAGGAPIEMKVVLELEAQGVVVAGPFELSEPGCTLGGISTDPAVASALSCYYAGGGDYVEVREKSPGAYVVVRYYRGEGYSDEPDPPKSDESVLGSFRAARPPLESEIVARDGGVYEAYR
jgi:hypothetical protein